MDVSTMILGQTQPRRLLLHSAIGHVFVLWAWAVIAKSQRKVTESGYRHEGPRPRSGLCERHPDALDRRGPTGEFRASRHANGRGHDGLRPLDAPPATP